MIGGIGMPELFVVFGLFTCCALYFLPTYFAATRQHSKKAAVIALNIFAGWTFLGWVGALVWSLLEDNRFAEKQNE